MQFFYWEHLDLCGKVLVGLFVLFVLVLVVFFVVVAIWPAPKPSGKESAELRKLMLGVAKSDWFKRQLKAWMDWLPWRRYFDRKVFYRSLEHQSEFRDFGPRQCVWRAGGWAGPNDAKEENRANRRWVFGIAPNLRKGPCGQSVMGHELLHAAQDVADDGSFFWPDPQAPWYSKLYRFFITWFIVENEAHWFGGPRIGFWAILVELLLFLAVLGLVIYYLLVPVLKYLLTQGVFG